MQQRVPECGFVYTGQESQQALQSYISQIKDVMPDFGDGFLAAALQHFSYNSEQVIHALLEGALPSELKGLDPQMPLQPASQTAQKAGKGASKPNSQGKPSQLETHARGQIC